MNVHYANQSGNVYVPGSLSPAESSFYSTTSAATSPSSSSSVSNYSSNSSGFNERLSLTSGDFKIPAANLGQTVNYYGNKFEESYLSNVQQHQHQPQQQLTAPVITIESVPSNVGVRSNSVSSSGDLSNDYIDTASATSSPNYQRCLPPVANPVIPTTASYYQQQQPPQPQNNPYYNYYYPQDVQNYLIGNQLYMNNDLMYPRYAPVSADLQSQPLYAQQPPANISPVQVDTVPPKQTIVTKPPLKRDTSSSDVKPKSATNTQLDFDSKFNSICNADLDSNNNNGAKVVISCNDIDFKYPNKRISNSNIKVKLLDLDLWNKFNEIGTEMIITKAGR